MPGKSHYQYVLELFKPDQAMTPVGRTPLDFDTAPVLEWCFTAARQTPPRATDFMAAAVAIDPLWDATLGEPYVDGLARTLTMDDRGAVECVVPTTCFLGQARQAVVGPIRGGALAAGTKVRFLVIAIPRPLDSGGAEDVIRFCVEAVPRPLPLAASRLEAFTDRAKAYERIDPVDVPAFIPQPLLDGVAAISRAAGALETGGILVGRLHGDEALPEIFVEITGQIPVSHAHMNPRRSHLRRSRGRRCGGSGTARRRDLCRILALASCLPLVPEMRTGEATTSVACPVNSSAIKMRACSVWFFLRPTVARGDQRQRGRRRDLAAVRLARAGSSGVVTTLRGAVPAFGDTTITQPKGRWSKR